jgi:hypothetical protein
MINWIKSLFKKKEEQRVVSFAWGDISGLICYDDLEAEHNKRKYYNVRDKKGRFTKMKGK